MNRMCHKQQGDKKWEQDIVSAEDSFQEKKKEYRKKEIDKYIQRMA